MDAQHEKNMAVHSRVVLVHCMVFTVYQHSMVRLCIE